jgi:hypothetical protein
MRHVMLPIYCLAIGGFAGCSRQAPPYDRLCRIYEEFSTQPLTSERAVQLAERVERELPEVYVDFGMIADADYRQRYELIRNLAREKGHQENWQCDAVRRVYTPPVR